VFMEQGLGKLCELHDIARDLERNVRTSWALILAPNIACIVGVFTLGFGIGISVLTNNVAALAALANGVRPMRKVAALEAERRHMLELQLRRLGSTNAEKASTLHFVEQDKVGAAPGAQEFDANVAFERSLAARDDQAWEPPRRQGHYNGSDIRPPHLEEDR
jgi:hypothetical protein